MPVLPIIIIKWAMPCRAMLCLPVLPILLSGQCHAEQCSVKNADIDWNVAHKSVFSISYCSKYSIPNIVVSEVCSCKIEIDVLHNECWVYCFVSVNTPFLCTLAHQRIIRASVRPSHKCIKEVALLHRSCLVVGIVQNAFSNLHTRSE